MPHIGMKELARRLNVSTATISKALRDSYDISDETKQKVLQLAKELNYTPNAHASSLRAKKSQTLAVVIPEVADSFFAQVINGVEAMAQSDGFHVLVYLTHEQLEKERAILKELLNGRVDGILISVTSQTTHADHIQELVTAGIPIVFFDRIFEHMGKGEVTTNDYQASYQLTQHLIEEGCQKIAFLLFSDALSITKKRLAGYKDALTQYGLQIQDRDIITCTDAPLENERRIGQLLGRKNRPDGIIASVEKLITSTYLACQVQGLHIPKDIKIAAFSNLATASILSPPITTVTQPAYEMGQAASTILIKAIQGKFLDKEDLKMMIPSKLDIRQSTMK